jgi:hypothetical protein
LADDIDHDRVISRSTLAHFDSQGIPKIGPHVLELLFTLEESPAGSL